MRPLFVPGLFTAALHRVVTTRPMSMSSPSVVRHDLHAFLGGGPLPRGREEEEESALVVLNSASFGPWLLERLWAASSFRVCADGGANRLFDLLGESHVPDAIVGDLDSARAAVLAAYGAAGAAVTRVEDQDANDLTKALAAVSARWRDREPGAPRVVRVVGAFGGRFDQEMAAFDALHKFAAAEGPHAAMVLYGDENAATLLPPGARHEITVRHDAEGPHCGLIPLGGPCRSVTTSGLEWDLDGETLAFGTLVSTSNLVARAGAAPTTVVAVEPSDPLVWTIDRKPP